MINKEEIEAIDILTNSIADFVIGDYCERCSDFQTCEGECYFNQAIDTVENLINKQEKRIKELEEINKEHQKINGNLQKRINELEEICKGKSIQEMGMSNLYKEDKR